MFHIEFRAHNSYDVHHVSVEAQRAAFELLCALDATGFSYCVTACGINVTAQFEDEIRRNTARGTLPITRTVGTTTLAEYVAKTGI